jgi:RNA polymerase sigma-70 factor (ECF subfamily)
VGEQPSDDSLIKLLAQQAKPRESKEAFRLLFDRHGGLVLGYCSRLLMDRSLAEDVAQDVWMKVIQNSSKYESRNQLRPWLLTISRNTCLNVLRARKEWVEITDDNSNETANQADLMTDLLNKSEALRVRTCIENLPPAQRTAISLLLIEGLSYEEIAQAMSLTAGSVKTHIHRGRQALMSSLREVK